MKAYLMGRKPVQKFLSTGSIESIELNDDGIVGGVVHTHIANHGDLGKYLDVYDCATILTPEQHTELQLRVHEAYDHEYGVRNPL